MLPIHITTLWVLEDHVKWKKPVTKDHILYDFIYIKCSEQANPYRHNVDCCFPGVSGGVEGMWGAAADGYCTGSDSTPPTPSLEQKCSKIDCGDFAYLCGYNKNH